MSAHEEEKTEQKYSDTSTAIEDETQGSSKEVSQISKAERKLVRKINIIFLPFVLCIGMLQVWYIFFFGLATITYKHLWTKQYFF